MAKTKNTVEVNMSINLTNTKDLEQLSLEQLNTMVNVYYNRVNSNINLLNDIRELEVEPCKVDYVDHLKDSSRADQIQHLIQYYNQLKELHKELMSIDNREVKKWYLKIAHANYICYNEKYIADVVVYEHLLS